MRQIWVKVDPWDKEAVISALEGGADGVMIPSGYSPEVKQLGRILTIAEDGDLKLGDDVIYYTITSGQDEEEILALSKTKKIILECRDWTIIPLENLIAKGAHVIAQVQSIKEAQTAFGILEKGVNHILLCMQNPADLKQALFQLKSTSDMIPLSVAEIKEIKPIGMGDRVCVDTCTEMKTGEGMLVGNSSSALFLVHSESVSNPYVAPRPFRVNAGPVHAYTRVPGGKTRYLSELAAGDPILIVDYQGHAVEASVGRLKIEKRPLILVKAVVNSQEITTILQNAETIRLTQPDGQPVSVSTLNIGDSVLVALESSGRHFGIKIDETITEK